MGVGSQFVFADEEPETSKFKIEYSEKFQHSTLNQKTVKPYPQSVLNFGF